jgi:SAM-dependent methyltransferase
MYNLDPWLDRWLPLIAHHATGDPILELGCGAGRDSATLVAAGHEVIGLDRSPSAVNQARNTVPAGQFFCQDMRDPWPVRGPSGVIVASLSLHYFPWAETVGLVERIGQQLRPGGLLLCRLNSTKDVHYGAVGHPLIEENYYQVKGEAKRFFDQAAVGRLFVTGWQVISLGEHTIHRYERPKVVWEVILECVG